MATITLNPQVLGQAENAHRAMLDQILRGPGMTYHQWVALTLAANAGPEIPVEQLSARLAGALKTDIDTATAALADLAAADLITDGTGVVRLTDLGHTRFGSVRADIERAMKQAYDNIAAADLATAGRVLAQVTAQLEQILAA
ncbi:hypothetical protein [Nocardia sp. NPDC050710]|uniref:hypothetical protein n=1 Tax=Nocardia sp. NPDC050710 TaxID=3157220 RepID=UPI0033C15637